MACIEQNIKHNLNYRTIERAVSYSYRHIREVFQRTTQISLSRYVLMRRVANVAFEIRHTKKSITEISLEYEFSNLDTFTRAFRRNTGLTPSEFRKSGYMCGRMIICPGVYAPVILDLAYPRLTLPKLREVNEMGEMKKTLDSCVLYGVPKIYFGRESEGLIQNTPFPMCLQAVLNYMGQNIDYTYLMAATGAAFRQRWDTNGWNFAAMDIRFIYDRPLEPFERGFKGAGRKFNIHVRPSNGKAIDKKEAIALIKSELDCGRPLIALGVVGPPEACVITGYRNHGETLLGWSLFQNDAHFGENATTDETGYFVKDNWWETTEAIMTIGEEVGEPPLVVDILNNAYMLMTQETLTPYNGNDIFYGGQAAYEAWAQALENDEMYGTEAGWEAKAGHGDQVHMLSEGRAYAALYISGLSEQNPALADLYSQCANLLQSASDCARDMMTSPARKSVAELVRKAAQYENEACGILQEIINQLGGGNKQRNLARYTYHVQREAQGHADAIYATPMDYTLRNDLPEEFKKHFAHLRLLIKDMYADMAQKPEAWGLKLVNISVNDKDCGSSTVKKMFHTLYSLCLSGELLNNQLVVSAEEFKNVIKHNGFHNDPVSKYELILSGLSDFGFVFSDFSGKAYGKNVESFIVEYPDNPVLIDTVKYYFASLAEMNAYTGDYACMYTGFLHCADCSPCTRHNRHDCEPRKCRKCPECIMEKYPNLRGMRLEIFDYRVIADASKMTAQQGMINDLIANGYDEKGIAFFNNFYEYSKRYKNVTLQPAEYGQARYRFYVKSQYMAEVQGSGDIPLLYLRLKNVQNYVHELKQMPDYIQNKFKSTTYDHGNCGNCGHKGATEEKCKSRVIYTFEGESHRRCVEHYFSFNELDEKLIPAYWRLLELDYSLK